MSDPVNTDALRRDARVLSPGFPGVEKRLHAAADELDRLRAEMVKAIREIRASNSEAQFERERAEGYERNPPLHLLESGRAVNGETGHYEGDEFVPTVPSQAGLLLDTLTVLPRLNSAALRKIADNCEKLIAGRMEDGVFE